MGKKFIAIIFTFSTLGAVFCGTIRKQDDCFDLGKCISEPSFQSVREESLVECQSACAQDAECQLFTFYPDTSVCEFYLYCDNIDTSECTGCITGYGVCPTKKSIKDGDEQSRDECPARGVCSGSYPIASYHTANVKDCAFENLYSTHSDFFTFYPREGRCDLFTWCYGYDVEECPTCLSGDWTCF